MKFYRYLFKIILFPKKAVALAILNNLDCQTDDEKISKLKVKVFCTVKLTYNNFKKVNPFRNKNKAQNCISLATVFISLTEARAEDGWCTALQFHR